MTNPSYKVCFRVDNGHGCIVVNYNLVCFLSTSLEIKRIASPIAYIETEPTTKAKGRVFRPIDAKSSAVM
jgi:hypothetical protein